MTSIAVHVDFPPTISCITIKEKILIEKGSNVDCSDLGYDQPFHCLHCTLHQEILL